MNISFGGLILLFFLIRAVLRRLWDGHSRSRVVRACRRILDNLAGSEGGNAQDLGWRRLTYAPPDKKVRLEIDCRSRPRLLIRAETPFPLGITFYRIPRLVFAFLEAFLPAENRLQQLPYLIFATGSPGELEQKRGFVPLMEQLSRFGVSLRGNSNGFTLWKSIREADLNEASFQEMLRLAENLAAIVTDSFEIPVQPLASDLHCAYCKGEIESSDAIYCSLCSTPHHRECFELNGKCSVFGCGALAARTQQDVNITAQNGLRL